MAGEWRLSRILARFPRQQFGAHDVNYLLSERHMNAAFSGEWMSLTKIAPGVVSMKHGGMGKGSIASRSQHPQFVPAQHGEAAYP